MPTLEEEYKQYTGAQGVNDMYEAQKKSQLAGLESAYQQNLSNAQAARDAIPGQYQARANDLAVQYERQRRNLNQQANANGLNTGAGSQMQLALGGNYNRDYGGIRTAQQQAIDQADRGIRDLQAAYNSSVQQAVADNDFRRTQALLADYQQRYQQQLQTAQNLANYGDFSGYAVRRFQRLCRFARLQPGADRQDAERMGRKQPAAGVQHRRHHGGPVLRHDRQVARWVQCAGRWRMGRLYADNAHNGAARRGFGRIPQRRTALQLRRADRPGNARERRWSKRSHRKHREGHEQDAVPSTA